MSNSYNQKTAELITRAKELLDHVRGQLNESDQFFRSCGLDREKLRLMLDARMSGKERAEAAALVEADLTAVAQEVAEGKARLECVHRSGRLKRHVRILV